MPRMRAADRDPPDEGVVAVARLRSTRPLGPEVLPCRGVCALLEGSRRHRWSPGADRGLARTAPHRCHGTARSPDRCSSRRTGGGGSGRPGRRRARLRPSAQSHHRLAPARRRRCCRVRSSPRSSKRRSCCYRPMRTLERHRHRRGHRPQPPAGRLAGRGKRARDSSSAARHPRRTGPGAALEGTSTPASRVLPFRAQANATPRCPS
jgi:hypothetical protein